MNLNYIYVVVSLERKVTQTFPSEACTLFTSLVKDGKLS